MPSREACVSAGINTTKGFRRCHRLLCPDKCLICTVTTGQSGGCVCIGAAHDFSKMESLPFVSTNERRPLTTHPPEGSASSPLLTTVKATVFLLYLLTFFSLPSSQSSPHPLLWFLSSLWRSATVRCENVFNSA